MAKIIWSDLIMRLGLGVIFLIGSIGILFKDARPPVDQIITFIPADTVLITFGLLKFAIGALLLIGLFTRLTSKVAAVLLLVIILSGVYLIMGPGTLTWDAMLSNLLKDFVLLGAALRLAKEGSDNFAADNYFRK